jgi:methyltransferase (TIGR00027 family)
MLCGVAAVRSRRDWRWLQASEFRRRQLDRLRCQHSTAAMNAPLIANVSDTARWVAAYRAQESARPDALFKDPLAARLAGEQGRRIAERASRANGNDGWPLVTRTKLIDDLIVASLHDGCDCVLNLAAGFDTRPYRMDLPASLTWIEADLPNILEEKERLLEDATPRCRLRREHVDLSDVERRAALLDEVAREHQRVLVITEGLLVYLDEATVTELARDLLSRKAFRWWITDLSSPGVLAMMQKTMGQELTNAPMKFAPENGVAFFEALGFRTRDMPLLVREAVRLKRAPWFFRAFMLFPDPDPRHLGMKRWGAVVRFERDSTR